MVLPFAALYFILYAKFAWYARTLSTQRFAVMWGGLYKKPHIYFFVLTFLLSSVGGILTFYLHVQFTSDSNIFPAFLFIILNVSCVICIYAIDSDNVKVVRICLWTNVVACIILFAYTIVAFHVDDNVVDNPTLLYITHICNAVAIFHVAFMDLIIWWHGWMENYE